jgi:hypothetical protein
MENNFGLRLNGKMVMSLVNDEKKVWNWLRRTISRNTCQETHPAVDGLEMLIADFDRRTELI